MMGEPLPKIPLDSDSYRALEGQLVLFVGTCQGPANGVTHEAIHRIKASIHLLNQLLGAQSAHR